MLAGLFSAHATSSGVKRKFHPNDKCVAAEQQRRSKVEEQEQDCAINGSGRFTGHP